MSIPESYYRVIVKLLNATRERRVHWRLRASNSLLIMLKDSSLQLSKYEDDFGETTYGINLFDADGEKVDSFSVEPSDDNSKDVVALYDIAYRRVSGIEATLIDLEQQLDTPDGTIGRPAPPPNED